MSASGEFIREQTDRLSYAAQARWLDLRLRLALPQDVEGIELLPDQYEHFHATPDFSEAAQASYATIASAIEAKHRDNVPVEQADDLFDTDILSLSREWRRRVLEDVELPPIDALSDQYMDVLPAYEAMAELELHPEVVLYPRMWSMDFWSQALTGYTPDYKVRRAGNLAVINNAYLIVQDKELPTESKGVFWHNHFFNDEKRERLIDPVGSPTVKDYETDWRIAVVSGRNKPAVTKIYPRANKYPRSNFTRTNRTGLELLRAAIGAPDSLDNEEVVALGSPTIGVYLGLQWLRLARGAPPVDIATVTLLQESVHDGAKYLTGAWGVNSASVCLPFVAHPSPDCGLRPTVTSEAKQYLAQA